MGSVAEWVSAVATFSAVVVALYFSKKETIDKRREEESKQAVKVSAWPVAIAKTKEAKVVISNSSDEPIYDVMLSYGVCYGAGLPYTTGNENLIFIKRVPPGLYESKEPKNPGGGMHTQTGISISFRDAKGKFWRRDATGRIKKMKNSPFVELEVQEPISNWTSIQTHEK